MALLLFSRLPWSAMCLSCSSSPLNDQRLHNIHHTFCGTLLHHMICHMFHQCMLHLTSQIPSICGLIFFMHVEFYLFGHLCAMPKGASTLPIPCDQRKDVIWCASSPLNRSSYLKLFLLFSVLMKWCTKVSTYSFWLLLAMYKCSYIFLTFFFPPNSLCFSQAPYVCNVI